MKSLLSASLALAPAMAQLTNPIFWSDFADLEVIRVDDAFYYTSSNMHYSPGAPVLRSYDLMNWEFIGHAIPELAFGDAYYLEGGQAYIQGTWASTLRYRESTSTFYWMGCIDGVTYVYTATDPAGPWTQSSTIGTCYYDCGLLFTSDDKIYVAYGNSGISVAELSADGDALSEVSTQLVFPQDDAGYIEGSRFIERDGTFYILTTHPAAEEHVLKSTSGPMGPYERRPLVTSVPSPVEGTGFPHQGGLVDTPNGDWYYTAFIDAYPGGRIPVFAPITWDSDGWPTVQLVDGGWGATYDAPNITPSGDTVNSFQPYTENFTGSALSAQWEWNHNPDNDAWSVGEGGLTLSTATVTDDLYAAKNTLTHRILGPTSSGTIHLDISSMAAGDRAGLALLRHYSAWIGVVNDGGSSHISVTSGLEMDSDWNTVSTGSETATAELSGTEVWLRLNADISPGGAAGQFSYSLDGETFTDLGDPYAMDTNWEFFMGYRYGIFNFATTDLGGSVTVSSFELAA
ncbi:putative xylosidase/glycosyl hydrolase [Aspergillus lucknowensis]|uniref:Glycosyl hydrolase n=1 Tax=Aspergillus lucknowensis TaxID=176173 RepID=A0ABR4LCL7_9EURO